jgi:hypothetical protein
MDGDDPLVRLTARIPDGELHHEPVQRRLGQGIVLSCSIRFAFAAR